MRTRVLLAPAVAIALATLAGCSVNVSASVGGGSAPSSSAPTSVTGSAVATVAEDALEKQVGSRPVIDCGQDDIPLIVGTVVNCLLTDPTSSSPDQTVDTTVTITSVSGTKYDVDVQVASTPNP